MNTDAFVAAARFGLGPGPGELAAIEAAGPRGWLVNQLDAPDPGVETALAVLRSGASAVAELADRRERNEPEERRAFVMEQRDAFVEEHAVHLAAVSRSSTPFRERLVAFWANHLTVSTTRKEVTALAGAFEREVVRAGIDGTYADLLVTSAKHPAMLAYLDNAKSVGPMSRAGQRSGRGINENYARELLELHTLGVNGGYTQTDVEALARLLTGWTVDIGPNSQGTGAFTYRWERHEPGSHEVLGRGYDDAEDAIRDLAVHPSTADHLATKLVRHFVADDPPAKAVRHVAKVYAGSGGSLPAVHRALVELDEPWKVPLTKVRTPWDLVMATARLVTPVPDGEAMLRGLLLLGQLPYRAPSPQGWPDRAEAWIGPSATWARLEWAELVGRRFASADAGTLLDAALGPAASASTRTAVRSASGAGAVAALLVSPEFQRR